MLQEMDIDHDGGLLFNTVLCYLRVEIAGVLDRHCLQPAEAPQMGRAGAAAQELEVMAY